MSTSKKADNRVIITVKDLLQNKVKRIKYKPGFSNSDITSDHGTTSVYSKVLFKLLELMIMDVIEGDIVYFHKRLKARFYIDWTPASPALIAGKGLKKDMKIPKVNFRVSGYKMPMVAFDPGYPKSTPCEVFVPSYLYGMLIDKVNSGKKYTKSVKDFWFNKKK